MSAPVLLAVGLLGGIGALARYLLDGSITQRVHSAYPFGILAVNLSGALVLGVIVGAVVHGDEYRLVAAGLLGSYTTFSTWVLNVRELAVSGRGRLALVDVLASLVVGLAAVWLGRKLGLAL